MPSKQSGRAAANAPTGAPGPAATVGTIRVQLDASQMTIGDLMLSARLKSIDRDALTEAEQEALVFECLPMFDRLVVGGIQHYKRDQLGDVIAAVLAAMNEVQNAGN